MGCFQFTAFPTIRNFHVIHGKRDVCTTYHGIHSNSGNYTETLCIYAWLSIQPPDVIHLNWGASTTSMVDICTEVSQRSSSIDRYPCIFQVHLYIGAPIQAPSNTHHKGAHRTFSVHFYIGACI
jgi:hypothetical protein